MCASQNFVLEVEHGLVLGLSSEMYQSKESWGSSSVITVIFDSLDW